jgi:hypothetical protein
MVVTIYCHFEELKTFNKIILHILIINWSLMDNLVLHHLVGLLLKLLIKLISLILLIVLLLSLWPCHLNIRKNLLSLII